jgi:hypothetical protein
MDDIVIPRNMQAGNPNRPPYASSLHPSSYQSVPQSNTSAMQLAVNKTAIQPVQLAVNPQLAPPLPADGQSAERFTVLVLKSNQVYEVTKYHRDGDLLMFVDAQGRKGSVDINDLDWRRTTEMTAEVRSVDATTIARQIN